MNELKHWQGFDVSNNQVDCIIEATDSNHAMTEFHAEGYTEVVRVELDPE